MKSLIFSLLCLVICDVILLVSSLSFTLPSGSRKCLKEDVHKDVLVTGEYKLSEAPHQKTHLKVTESTGHVLYSKDDATKGKFAFTTDDYEMYEVCFESEASTSGGSDREIFVNIKHGVEAKNYEDLGKAEKLKPMEIELKRMEDLADAIVNDFAYMRQREQEMRDTNESTNSRVLYFSVFSILCLFGLATWQLFYLRRFFIAKKLIE
ncbi:transmembrane emp24 domain-containing protein 10-like [Actinia tenebrosa]|uniref:Transmembrane emp24 domain-containing protein 10-like n=1 Tax=Actinia tenebrosa TaxID=6105 RepID=A0A6P8HEC6_ACTTE|nr:transmembrane emp24 domain-containing protein 10-like [Actinia tenebrosa]